MIIINKTEKSYYTKQLSPRRVIEMLIECLPDEFNTENLSGLSEKELADKLESVIDCFEVSEYLDSELVETDCGDEWEIECVS